LIIWIETQLLFVQIGVDEILWPTTFDKIFLMRFWEDFWKPTIRQQRVHFIK